MRKGLLFKRNKHLEIEGYADTNWARDINDIKSTSGYYYFIGGNLVSWKSKKQTVVARSIEKAEYIAMVLTTCKMYRLKCLLHDIEISHASPMKLFSDSKATIYIKNNLVSHERTKHIVDCHFLKEKIQSRVISTNYIQSSFQPTNMLTKSISKETLQSLSNNLGLFDIIIPT